MQRYEYRVIPAPARAEKARGAKTTEDRYAQTLASLMNAQGREGWEFLRAETLPTEERSGFTRRSTVYVNLLVFRRPASETPAGAPAPEQAQPSFFGLGRLTGSRPGAPPSGAAPKIAPATEGPAPKLGPATDSGADGT